MPNYTGVRVQIPPLTPVKRPGSYRKMATFFIVKAKDCCPFRYRKEKYKAMVSGECVLVG